MTKDKAIQIIFSDTPKNSKELLKAIKSLGSSEKDIKKNLIELGFQTYNQRKAETCPVCQYLKKIGLNSPYIDVGYNLDEVRISAYSENDFIQITLPKNIAMNRFQRKATKGKYKEFGGYEDGD